jgi:hypothetical protein
LRGAWPLQAVWVRFGAGSGPQKHTFDPAAIGFCPVFKMGSFCKNDVFHSLRIWLADKIKRVIALR